MSNYRWFRFLNLCGFCSTVSVFCEILFLVRFHGFNPVPLLLILVAPPDGISFPDRKILSFTSGKSRSKLTVSHVFLEHAKIVIVVGKQSKHTTRWSQLQSSVRTQISYWTSGHDMDGLLREWWRWIIWTHLTHPVWIHCHHTPIHDIRYLTWVNWLSPLTVMVAYEFSKRRPLVIPSPHVVEILELLKLSTIPERDLCSCYWLVISILAVPFSVLHTLLRSNSILILTSADQFVHGNWFSLTFR